ncbi:MAG: hypothetical protein NVS3B2_07800 [Ramlibacter sp.]
MSTPVCIANAVADALGLADIVLPLTPLRVMDLIGMDDPAPSRGSHSRSQCVRHSGAPASAVPPSILP